MQILSGEPEVLGNSQDLLCLCFLHAIKMQTLLERQVWRTDLLKKSNICLDMDGLGISTMFTDRNSIPLLRVQLLWPSKLIPVL